MNLRQKIERLIDAGQTSNDASMLICTLLNYELSLQGNGGFEDDLELDALFEYDEEAEEQGVETAGDRLWNRVESILDAQ